MKFILNLLWLCTFGLASAVCWFVLGLLWCITVIGIPFGKQCFKMARLYFFPFGTQIHPNFFKHPIANLIWAVFGGFSIAVAMLGAAFACAVTIIGIPFALQCLKLAVVGLAPFGAKIR